MEGTHSLDDDPHGRALHGDPHAHQRIIDRTAPQMAARCTVDHNGRVCRRLCGQPGARMGCMGLHRSAAQSARAGQPALHARLVSAVDPRDLYLSKAMSLQIHHKFIVAKNAPKVNSL